MNFSEKLRTMRKQFKLSQEQLAEKINVSRQAITKWETEGGLPDIENLMAIAALFSVSMDELLSTEKTVKRTKEYAYESVTELDISGRHDFDVRSCGVTETLVAMTDDEKVRVRLASNVIQNVQGEFKVRIDEHKSRMDIDIKRVGSVSDAEAKEAISLAIYLPRSLCDETELNVNCGTLRLHGLCSPFELDGKVQNVEIKETTGRVSLNSSLDMDISCDRLPSSLEINQISASTILRVVAPDSFYTKVKGKSNSIRYFRQGKAVDSFASPDAGKRVELAGMNAELQIDMAAGGK